MQVINKKQPKKSRADLIFASIDREMTRQRERIELIASENIVSEAVLAAQGSILTNKYAEGYPGRRYYGGCEHVDEVERLAIEWAKELFKCQYANVQPHSGAQANTAVFLAFLKPGDTILSMSLAHGGHLTHGASVTLSGKWFNAVHYGVTETTMRIDIDQVREVALRHHPKLIIAGGSAYARIIDFAAFRAVADEVGAVLMADIAHYAGLVAAGVYPSPLPHAHVTTTTTHKTLRGPRGGIILTNDLEIAQKINASVFPGSQGGPLMHVIAAKAVALWEALQPEFQQYANAVLCNARALCDELRSGGLNIVSGGTDCHLMLVDLRSKNVTGRLAEDALERVGITCNRNGIPFDTQKPSIASGIRLGTAAVTTRGFGALECRAIGRMIVEVIDAVALSDGEFDLELETRVRGEVRKLCEQFPIYSNPRQAERI